ncbi:PREDICTED: uncharacterized protein LOC104611562 isoform X2 [Nelumbo nucifera]|uniref:Uncharacterized protein LOC104611562 isoform X2 n=1 Tax=Nelumbo nucifera TaxID=4432 RepID=A0A1U8BJL7_NELNU|nr:PREDICTED: uncharacterized protein LOC104611562 isoform X2 [Nelumbo nucifera]
MRWQLIHVKWSFRQYLDGFKALPFNILQILKMKPKANGISRAEKSKKIQEGPNWILIIGGALLSTLSIRVGYKLKQALYTKRPDNGNKRSVDKRRPGTCISHSNPYSFAQDEDSCCNVMAFQVEVKRPPTGLRLQDTDLALPLVKIPALESNKENGVIWASSPDRLELPPRPFHHSNSSDSLCVSESGSDIFTKREVIQKLRQQLKRRDEMILEMQDQITSLQSSLSIQLAHSTNLQSQLDAANRDLFESEREIQRLRKAIADHCVGDRSPEKSIAVRNWSAGQNGHVNGFIDGESNLEVVDKGRGDGERIEMLKREVGELKEVIEGKEYLLQNYKEQKAELSSKVKELQQRLASQGRRNFSSSLGLHAPCCIDCVHACY